MGNFWYIQIPKEEKKEQEMKEVKKCHTCRKELNTFFARKYRSGNSYYYCSLECYINSL